jgi:hypothetical protein
MNRRLTLLIAPFFILIAFVSAFHHHDNDISHQDCPLCITQCLSAVVVDKFSFTVHQNIVALDLPKEILSYPSIIPSSLSTRAPPA